MRFTVSVTNKNSTFNECGLFRVLWVALKGVRSGEEVKFQRLDAPRRSGKLMRLLLSPLLLGAYFMESPEQYLNRVTFCRKHYLNPAATSSVPCTDCGCYTT